MKKVWSLIPLCLLNLAAFSQDTTVTFYFKTGQSHLLSSQKKVIEDLRKKPVTKMTFAGYADTVGRASSNKKLSYKRAAKAAQAYKDENKEIIGGGESKERKIALSKMRKVVVNVWYNKPVIELVIPEVKKEPVAKIDSCKTDITFNVSAGSMITMNKCYYEKIKGCFSYKEYLDARSVQEAGLRTIDEKGDPIESGGMIDIKFCADTCINKPIIVFIPVPPCLSGQPMTLWNITRNNTWRNSRNKIEIVTIKGKEYYKMEIYCPGRLNCDKPKKSRYKLKIKLKNGLKFKSATISYNCPIYSMNGKLNRKKNKAVFPYICPNSEPLLYIKAIDKKGDTLVINNRNINNYIHKRKLHSFCNCTDGSREHFLGIFKINRKLLYRKYKIFRKDF